MCVRRANRFGKHGNPIALPVTRQCHDTHQRVDCATFLMGTLKPSSVTTGVSSLFWQRFSGNPERCLFSRQCLPPVARHHPTARPCRFFH